MIGWGVVLWVVFKERGRERVIVIFVLVIFIVIVLSKGLI